MISFITDIREFKLIFIHTFTTIVLGLITGYVPNFKPSSWEHYLALFIGSLALALLLSVFYRAVNNRFLPQAQFTKKVVGTWIEDCKVTEHNKEIEMISICRVERKWNNEIVFRGVTYDSNSEEIGEWISINSHIDKFRDELIYTFKGMKYGLGAEPKIGFGRLAFHSVMEVAGEDSKKSVRKVFTRATGMFFDPFVSHTKVAIDLRLLTKDECRRLIEKPELTHHQDSKSLIKRYLETSDQLIG